MSFSPIAFISPNFRDFKNDYLKAYEPGTTTPKVMALESNGGTQVAKLQLNADGFIISAGNALVIPYIDGAYDLWLFPTEAEADANDTSNAERLADNIIGISSSSVTTDLINDLSQSYEFPTVAAFEIFATLFPDGKTIHLNDRDADFTKVSGTTPGNGIIVSTSVNQSIELITNGVVNVRAVGVVTTDTPIQQHTKFLEAIALLPASGGKFVIPYNTYSIDIATGNCNLDFDGKSNVILDGNNAKINWINAQIGGTHTGGRFKTEDGMKAVSPLHIDGGITTLTMAQALSFYDVVLGTYANGIQRGFYIQSDTGVDLSKCSAKHFRHFGIDFTGTTDPTQSVDIVLNDFLVEDCFAYTNTLAAIVRARSLSLKGFTSRNTAASEMTGFVGGLRLEPATTNGQDLNSIIIDGVISEGCELQVITTEEDLTVNAIITNLTSSDPDSTGSTFGLFTRGLAGLVSNVRIASGGRFLLNAPDNKDAGTENTQTNNYRMDFTNIQVSGENTSKNLILDADFRTLDSWTVSKTQGAETATLSPTAINGENILVIDINTIGSGTGIAVFQEVPNIKPNTLYTFGVWAKSSGESAPGNPSNFQYVVDFRSGSTSIESWLYQIPRVGDDVYDKLLACIKSPAGCDNVRILQRFEGSGGANGVGFVDGIFLYEGVSKDYFSVDVTPVITKILDEKIITDTQPINIANVPANDSVVIVRTLMGAVPGDNVVVTKPNEASHAKISYGAVVTANDTIDLFAYNCTLSDINPTSATTFSFTIIKH